MVGSAKGRSMSALTNALAPELVAHQHPGDERARTTLTATTASDARTVRRSAARDSGLHTECQKPLSPLWVDSATTAASGISTMMLR